MSVEPFELLSEAALRARTSIKWRQHPPDVLPLWIAEMDVLPPPSVIEAVTRAVRDGDTGYSTLDPAYAESLARLAARRWGWELDVSATTIVADVLTGMGRLIELLTERGDPVLIPSPVYFPFFLLTEELGRQVVPVPLTTDHRLDPAALDAALGRSGARVVLLCSPHNPTGTLHTADELAAVAAVTDAHGASAIVDEIHAPLVPDGATFTPWLAVSDTGFTVTSASKAYNLAGLKAGVIVAGESSREVLDRLPQSTPYGASHLGSIAHRAAWDGGDEWLAAVNANIVTNAELLTDLLAERLPAVRFRRMQATYLAWLDCSALGLGDDPAAVFLERGRLALSDGLQFGLGGTGHARLNVAASRATLTEAVSRMAATL